MRSLFSAVAALPLAACMVTPSGQLGPGEQAHGICKGDQLGQFVGQPATQELGARMMSVSGATILRWAPKGSAVTMDFREERLTVALDGANRVELANCG